MTIDFWYRPHPTQVTTNKITLMAQGSTTAFWEVSLDTSIATNIS